MNKLLKNKFKVRSVKVRSVDKNKKSIDRQFKFENKNNF